MCSRHRHAYPVGDTLFPSRTPSSTPSTPIFRPIFRLRQPWVWGRHESATAPFPHATRAPLWNVWTAFPSPCSAPGLLREAVRDRGVSWELEGVLPPPNIPDVLLRRTPPTFSRRTPGRVSVRHPSPTPFSENPRNPSPRLLIPPPKRRGVTKGSRTLPPSTSPGDFRPQSYKAGGRTRRDGRAE